MHKNPIKNLKSASLSTKIILMVELVLLLSSSVFCAVSIINSRYGIRQSIQQRMLDIANCAAGSVNGDILEKLTAEDADTPEYREIYNTLAVFRDNVELEYVYGIRDEGGGRFTFTVDPDPVNPGPFGSEVKYTEALATASKGTAAVDAVPYTDAWGTFFSAYSPVFNSAGKVAGIIAADFSDTWFESQLSAQTKATIISYSVILLVMLLTSAILSMIIVRPYVQKQEQLSAELEKQANENKHLSLQIVRSLADAIDAKDIYTKNHSTRVSQYSVRLAEALGWEEERINDLRYAALLHDIGKIGVPDSILTNPKNLTEVEYGIVKSHTEMGGDILKSKIILQMAEDVARSHHERYDGTGYPRGLKGTEISEEARIVSIADAFDAMKSNRAYRKPCDPQYIKEELTAGKGKQFDPHFTDVFIGLWEKGLLDDIAEYNPEEDLGNMEASSVLLQEVVGKFMAQGTADEIDIITGIKSRSAGEAAIAQAMKTNSGCLVFLDMDNLKKINDNFGHEAGDKALRMMGDTLTANSENSICCRLGGDEFLCFLKDVTEEEAGGRVQKIISEFDEKKNADAETAMATISAGLAMCTPADNYMKIYNRADQALYFVKQSGKNSFQFYNQDSQPFKTETVDVNKIVSSIRTSGSYTGAMDVEYRHFAMLYEFIENIKMRFSHPFKLIMITLNAAEGESYHPEDLEKAMYYMEQAIQQTIRNVDVITRYSRQQFLIILLGTNTEGVQIAVNRIIRGYYKMNGNSPFTPDYAVAEMDV
ncbi:MAG: diguanylate cyclase [Clostridia bacterium]|nr:diguanylate cyclase [Clostridia bacterium]